MKLWIAHRILDAIARVIWHRNNRQTVQFAACRFIDRWLPFFARSYFIGRPSLYRPDHRATALNHLLCQFTRIDPRFTLHVDVENADAMIGAAAGNRGVLICTAHLRLTFAVHGVLRDLGLKPVFVGFVSPKASGWNWGHPDPITTIDAARADVLIKCAAHIRRGDIVIAFVDHRPAGLSNSDAPPPVAISPNAFVWARNSGVPVLFLASRLTPDGRIVIEFQKPEAVATRPDAAEPFAIGFADFIERRTGWRCVVRRPKEIRGLRPDGGARKNKEVCASSAPDHPPMTRPI